MVNNAAKKKGAGGVVFFILSLVMILLSSVITYRGIGSVRFLPGNDMMLSLSVFKLLAGGFLALSIFLINRLNDKKAAVIPLSIVNMIIALLAFLPLRRYYYPLRFLPMVFSSDPASGIMYLLHFVFIALIFVFSLLIMLAAVKKDRRRPKELCTLILIFTGIYAAFSLVSILFTDPLIYGAMRYRGLHNVKMALHSLRAGNPIYLLFIWRNTLHDLFPFTTLFFYLSLFFAARSIGPAAKAVPASGQASVFTGGRPAPEAAPQYSAYTTPAFREAEYTSANQAVPIEPMNAGEAAKERELRELAALLQNGTITHADYEMLRQRILRR